ncbi:membrane-associated tyrosine- and threonine-specific cdc2-inhibitory kinase wee-1.3-like [Tropilaelaps mercedesae]|uniref:Membrane-associated tyrosine-and threonine-specific cdc2-inhibitory kinase wee-1.3-like n=1 Tax=Tropilaelaps mercedesae TaxID=418985 RepID=A0A1V9XZW2_9ACAR|nr:membrane-associated tyrosine- and threonine-specific cdc2-inhibitory kinase wee-1.3-like [Tropilaelaps mercedesae]
MEQNSPAKRRLTAARSTSAAKKMRSDSSDDDRLHWRGFTPYLHLRQRRLDRVKHEEMQMLNVAEGVSFTGNRNLDSPYYNKTRSYFTSCFEQLSCLGSGDYGQVFKCRSKDDGQLYAVKVLSKEFASEKDRRNITREVQLLETTPPHENIVRFVFAWQENMTLYIQTELCSGDLLSFLKSLTQPATITEEPRYAQPEKVPESLCWSVLVDVLQGAAYLHSKGVLHLDIKPENIFIGLVDDRCKLGDFGIARKISECDGIEQDGDGRYAAPETYDNDGKLHVFTEKADTFSIGCTVAQVALGITYPRHPRYENYWSRLKLNVDEWHEEQSLIQDMSDKSQELWDIVRWLLTFDAANRPTPQQVLEDKAVQIHVEERRRRLARDSLMSRIRAVVSNVITLLSQFLPRDLISRLRPLMLKAPSSPYPTRNRRRNSPATPRVSTHGPLGTGRRSRQGLCASSTPSRSLLRSSDSEDERSAGPINLSAAFSDDEPSPIKNLKMEIEDV